MDASSEESALNPEKIQPADFGSNNQQASNQQASEQQAAPDPIAIGPLALDRLDALATALLRRLPTPLVIGLTGTLGAGKTTLVQAMARAADIDAADVTSPTFTLLQTHHGKITLHHLDAYRLADEDEFLELGVEELFEEPGCWTLVEWADRVPDVLPRETLWIEITTTEQAEARCFTFRCDFPSLQRCVEQARDELRG